ncbi:hypothetical protein AB9F45_18610 [Rhizobium leguminosarum]|uniref:hypothetical protein n=1 Tax=Rhizobium leguminosarum TaxID=384 RepID=UPI003F9B2ED6
MLQLALEPEPVNSTDTCLWPNLYGHGPTYNAAGLDATDLDQPYGWYDSQIYFGEALSDCYPSKGDLISPRSFIVRVSTAGADRSDIPGILFGSEKPVYRSRGTSWSIPAQSIRPCPIARSQFKARTHPMKVISEPAMLWAGLVERLIELRQDAVDDGIEPLMDSWSDFLRFSLINRVSVRPSLSVVDTGAIRAVWKNADNEQVTLHFKGGNVINYVIFHLQEAGMQREFAQISFSDTADLIKQRQLWRLLIAAADK